SMSECQKFSRRRLSSRQRQLAAFPSDCGGVSKLRRRVYGASCFYRVHPLGFDTAVNCPRLLNRR
ncbi:MAG: hypothetical protein KF753_16135, partial [Caldilineaceae bacterium]|nr:hypothetical protein [Caldilineaceae bacterium]